MVRVKDKNVSKFVKVYYIAGNIKEYDDNMNAFQSNAYAS